MALTRIANLPTGLPRLGEPRVLLAEALGTFWLVFIGCGSAVIASNVRAGDGAQVGIGLLGVALAFGLAVTTMAYAVGGVSGGHFNPAVTVGLAVAGRFEWRRVPGYIVTQLVAATAAGIVLFAVSADRPGFDATASGFATNGFGDRSPDHYSLLAALVAEIVLTAVFVGVIAAVTGGAAPQAVAPLAIGLTLTLTNLVAIPIDNASINPARSLGVAWFAGSGALSQLWLFLIAPTVGGAVAGLVVRSLGQGGNDGDLPESADSATRADSGTRPATAPAHDTVPLPMDGVSDETTPLPPASPGPRD
ncbi:aquaporin Z [uncultured Amnibacterium sp.]|uniref:aquaporin Z n=1 Tax=uncultured Amnibacterium sp. TaxID=1631851 RepID=UPI0035CB186C